MKNSFGQSVSLCLFGESHGSAVGAVLDGLAPGLPVDEALIAAQLLRRRPRGETDTPRREPDRFKVVSGVFNGRTTGTPLCILIPNEDTRSGDYAHSIPRPSHADYAAFCKYHGYEDYRGGGHFSGRVTAALAAAGGILLPALEGIGITLGTHILRCAGCEDRPFDDIPADIELLRRRDFPALSQSGGESMVAAILRAREAGDSVGGVTQTAAVGLPSGIGEPWFDSVEGLLSHALFSLGGIKGVEFGGGFALAESTGSLCNDAFYMDKGEVKTKSNNSGGINGGITNGMPLVFQCAVKPTASIPSPQHSVDIFKGEDTLLTIKGRHDPAIVRRVCPVIDSVTALVLCDLLAQRYGTDVFLKGAE